LTFFSSWALAQINQEKMSDEQPIKVNGAITNSLSLMVSFPYERAYNSAHETTNKPFSNEVIIGRGDR
jgi:hypothetical protein